MWIWLANFMGRSLLGIPEDLRSADKKSLFVIWLAHLPISKNAKRPLIQAWRAHTKTDFVHADYIHAGFF